MIKLKNLKLIGLMSLLVSFNAYSLDANKQIEISQMLNNFLDLSLDSEKPFETWIDDLTALIGREPEFAKFAPILAALKAERNIIKAQLKLVQNQKLAPAFVQEILKKKPLAELKNILTRRMQRRGA